MQEIFIIQNVGRGQGGELCIEFGGSKRLLSRRTHNMYSLQ